MNPRMRRSSLLEQLGRCAVDGRVPGLGKHAMTDEQCLPVVDREGLVFVVDGFAARAEHPDLVRELPADGRGARARPELDVASGSAVAIQHVVRGLEVAHALEGRPQVLVVFVAFDAEVGRAPGTRAANGPALPARPAGRRNASGRTRRRPRRWPTQFCSQATHTAARIVSSRITTPCSELCAAPLLERRWLRAAVAGVRMLNV